jgi:UDP-glucose:(heptosyl)LPS alpha-1,3-glucosyltransferase
MRIALVIHDFSPNCGHGYYAMELARRLATKYAIAVYANRFCSSPIPGVSFQKVPAWRRTALTTVLTFIPCAERRLRRQSFDLVHAQGLTCWQADIITAHICNAARLKHAPPSTWRSRLFGWVVCPLERRFYQQVRAKHLIAVSSQLANEIRRYYHWQRTCTVIHHGTDTTRYRPPLNAEEHISARHRFQLPPQAWVWLFVGEAVKGLRQVIEQLPAFPEATLLVISRSQLSQFKRLARKLKVDSRIRFWGPEPSPELAYRAANVFVYPSDYDAFGLVVAEAMASELPAVVGQNIGAAEWIVSSQNGLLCDPHAPDTLSTQLEWLRADPNRALAIGRAARVTVMKHSWDACAAATAAVYEEVLDKKRA